MVDVEHTSPLKSMVEQPSSSASFKMLQLHVRHPVNSSIRNLSSDSATHVKGFVPYFACDRLRKSVNQDTNLRDQLPGLYFLFLIVPMYAGALF